MAMEDIYKLTEAIVRGEMAKPASIDNLVCKGPWTRARVEDATLHFHHESGYFTGSVRYQVEGEAGLRISTFHDLWLETWTLPPEQWPGARKPKK